MDFGHHDWKETDQGEGICYIANANIRALHAVLAEKIAEQDAKRWVVTTGESSSTVQPANDLTKSVAAIFWKGDHFADAEEYAAKLNAREGLA